VNAVDVQSWLPLIPLVILTGACVLIPLLGERKGWREGISLAAAVLTLGSVLAMLPAVLAGQRLVCTISRIAPGISLSLRADALSMIFGILASFLYILATFYNGGYLKALDEKHRTRYYFCFAVAILGAQGVAFAGGLLTLYLFYEVITFFTYPLVAHHQTEDAYAGGQKYLVYLMGTSKGFLLPAMVLTYVLAGTLDFAGNVTGGIFPPTASRFLVGATFILFIFGLAKAALMPFHGWLPSAMVAPAPVSALLHAVAVVKAGVFSIARVVLFVFGTDLLGQDGLGSPAVFFACLTIIVASIIALTKDDLKARLAYSTVAQLSYVVLGVSLLNQSAVTGGLLHILNHGVAKITLFFCAGAIYAAAHKKKISEMDGIGYQMPWTMTAFALASLTMIGVPPVAGFTSKWLIYQGAGQACATLVTAVLAASTLLNAAYFVPVTVRAFLRKPAPDHGHGGHGHDDHAQEAPAALVVPLFITACLSVLLGLFPGPFLTLIGRLF
jgi:multicomponent Na+:H+ antiporter subunit D